MSSRHLARSITLQSLYEWDFSGGKKDPKEVIEKNIDDAKDEIKDKEFIYSLVGE